jgi:hypothetical protein
MANKLSEIVTKKDLHSYAIEASESVKNASWEESGKHFVEVIETSTKARGAK